MNYYIATKLENWQEHNRLRDVLSARGHNCTYDWTVHGPVYTSGLDRIKRVARLEHQGVADADVVIVLWPGGRGTHVELGMAIALGKDIVLATDVIGHHEPSPETCAFYHHPHVKLTHDLVDVVDYIVGKYHDV